MLTGEYQVTFDEKGRIMVPSRLRAAIGGEAVYVTKGLENCLWVLLPSHLESIARTIMNAPGAMFVKTRRDLQRRIVAPAVLCSFDKAGRINIPQSLRDYAGITLKGEAVLSGLGDYMELWNSDAWKQAVEGGNETFSENAEALLNGQGV